MAYGFSVFLVPDSHIAHLRQHADAWRPYLQGQRPNATDVPGDWPTAPLEFTNGWSVNHRNCDLDHWILNGGPALVGGSGSLFQTWYEPTHASAAIPLDRHNEAFAYESGALAELADLVGRVDVPAVRAAFAAWCRSQGKDYEPDEYACQPFVDEFQAFGAGLAEARRLGQGILWAPC